MGLGLGCIYRGVSGVDSVDMVYIHAYRVYIGVTMVMKVRIKGA